MSPQTWSDVASYMVLALGAAMALGTGVALVRYHRTGVFPGQELDDEGRPEQPPAIRSAWVKVGVGTVLAVWGFAGLISG